MKSLRVHICLCALLLCGTMSSCMFDYEDDRIITPEPKETGEGLVSIVLFSDDSEITSTRASDPTYMNLLQEKKVNSARIILYDTDGIARYVRDYDPSDITQWVENQYPVYQTKGFKVKKQKYQLAVLINHRKPWNYFNSDYNADAMDIEFRTREVGHSKSVLTDIPLDFAVAPGLSNSYDKAKSLAMQALTGAFDTPPSYASPEYITDNFGFFMSNANGLTDVDLSHIKDVAGEDGQAEEKAREEAELDPVMVYVERAVAKVAFFADEQLSSQKPLYLTYSQTGSDPPPAPSLEIDPDGVLDAAWRTDMLNMKVYPIRKKAPIAPVPYGSGAGGSMETTETDQRDRYAIDPNYTNVPGSLTGELFGIPGDISDPIYTIISGSDKTHDAPGYIGLPLKIPFDHMAGNDIDVENDPQLTYDHFEYVPENTTLPSGHHTSAVTHVLLKMNLSTRVVWSVSESIGGVVKVYDEMSGDYAYYDGVIYPAGELYVQILRGSKPPFWVLMMPKFFDPETYNPETQERTRLNISPFLAKFTSEQKQAFVDNMVEVPDGQDVRIFIKEAKEIAGVKFFKNGAHYYRIPIRHFDNTQSPDNDGYGRYGVVRNNTYVIKLEEILGPGEPTLPPTGALDTRSSVGRDNNSTPVSDGAGSHDRQTAGEFSGEALKVSVRSGKGIH